jgi:hypothetical protein
MLRAMKRTTTSLALFAPLALLPVVFFACGGENGNLPPAPPAPSALPVVSAEPPAPSASASDTGTADLPKPPDVVLSIGTPAPDPSDKPTVRITSPSKDQIIASDKSPEFEIKLDVKKWPTAPHDAHVHLILDNTPYKPIYDTKKPIKLSELPGGKNLAEGQHVLFAFPSRATHESVKTPGAVAVVQFWIGKKKGTPTVDLTKPTLIYSRPKGDYKGEMANHVLVDFQLLNDTLAAGKDHVHIKVTGTGIDTAKEADAVAFGPPFYLDNLQNGSYTVRLELRGGDDTVLPGPYNATERKIVVDHNAPADMSMAPAPSASGSAAPPPMNH